MLDLNHLRAFARVADLGSISGAARSLRSPKSSISRSLARLEEAVGAVLVERSTRHLRLTDAGLLLQRYARRILDDVQEAEAAVGGLLDTPSGDLRVNVPVSFSVGPLATMLPQFIKSYPNVRVVLTLDNRPIDVSTDEIDVAIRIGPLPDSDLIRRRVTTFALWLCASPAYLQAHGTPRKIIDLQKHKLITLTDQRSTWKFRNAAGVGHKVDVAPGIVISEPTVAKAVIAGGAAIGLLPDFYAAASIANGTLVRLLPAYCGPTLDAHALYPSHRSLSVKVRVFVDALIAHLATAG
ncbi:MAG: LysR family transcriptional regulator [Chthoniobacterales bacterium]